MILASKSPLITLNRKHRSTSAPVHQSTKWQMKRAKEVDIVQKDHQCFRQFVIDCPAMKAPFKITLLLLYLPLISLCFDHLHYHHIVDEILQFCDVNGFKFVTLDDLNNGDALHYGRYISSKASSRGIRIRFLNLDDDFDHVQDMDMLVRNTTEKRPP